MIPFTKWNVPQKPSGLRTCLGIPFPKSGICKKGNKIGGGGIGIRQSGGIADAKLKGFDRLNLSLGGHKQTIHARCKSLPAD